jgi:sulfonate dioxygenase
MFASSYAAYDRLSPSMQKFLEGLQAKHSAQRQFDEAKAQNHVIRRTHVESIHPVIR